MSNEMARVFAWPVELAAPVPAVPVESGDDVPAGIESASLAPVLSLTRQRQLRPAADADSHRRGMADHPAGTG